MATFVELKNVINLSLLQTFKTQQDAKFQALLDEKEALGTAAGLVGNLTGLKTEAKDKVVAAINEVHDDAAAAQATADSAVAKIGELPETSATVVDLINSKVSAIDTAAGSLGERVDAAQAAIDAIEADYLKAADKEALQTQVTANKNALDVLNGTGEGSVDKQITDAINKFASDVSDDSTVNTFKELVDWAASHTSEAADIVSNVTANANAISALQTKVGTIPETSAAADVIGYVDEQVAAEKTRAEAAEAGIGARIDALEGSVGTGGSVDSKIDTAKEEAVTASKTYTDAEVTKDRARLDTAEADIDALEASLGEGGETKLAIEAAQAKADEAMAKANANETAATALTARVAALETWAEGITLASEADILAMFA